MDSRLRASKTRSAKGFQHPKVRREVLQHRFLSAYAKSKTLWKGVTLLSCAGSQLSKISQKNLYVSTKPWRICKWKELEARACFSPPLSPEGRREGWRELLLSTQDLQSSLCLRFGTFTSPSEMDQNQLFYKSVAYRLGGATPVCHTAASGRTAAQTVRHCTSVPPGPGWHHSEVLYHCSDLPGGTLDLSEQCYFVGRKTHLWCLLVRGCRWHSTRVLCVGLPQALGLLKFRTHPNPTQYPPTGLQRHGPCCTCKHVPCIFLTQRGKISP